MSNLILLEKLQREREIDVMMACSGEWNRLPPLRSYLAMIHSTYAVAILALYISFISPAAADSLRYRFVDSTEPAFHYVSGDLPCEITASLSGDFSISLDNESHVATLRFADVILTNTETAVFGQPHEYPEGHFCQEGADNMHGELLSSIMPGVTDEILGHQVGPGEFQFEATLTSDRAYMRAFTIRTVNNSLQLLGASEFYGDDGPSYYIEASIAAVPEPSGLHLLAFSIAVVITLKSHGRKTNGSELLYDSSAIAL